MYLLNKIADNVYGNSMMGDTRDEDVIYQIKLVRCRFLITVCFIPGGLKAYGSLASLALEIEFKERR